MSTRKYSSVSIESADNGFILRMCDYTSKKPKDIVRIAKTETEAQKVMQEMMAKAY